MKHYQKKIYYHDTDAGGVVYYANYLKYLEEARTEYLRAKGIDLKELAKEGIWFVVKNVDITYRVPGRYADTLDIVSEITKTKNVSLEFFQEIKRDAEALVSAKTTLVCVTDKFKPTPIPQEITEKLTS
ncbi:MAG: YbgC/FadM family acyl-CoA thioesterase [Candidatus Omnitrophota bacterium]|nr:MAG: YbgC/FadM family acyl-CoA thioesterase [Candidatus Omnitrophota bacterium]